MPPAKTRDTSGGQPYESNATGFRCFSNGALVYDQRFQTSCTKIILMPVSWLWTKLMCLTAPCLQHARGRCNSYWMTISCQKSCLSFLWAALKISHAAAVG